MKLELAMASRLSLKAPGISVAVAGIALSVAVMIVSLAIVSGFKRQIREKVTGFEHEISVFPLDSYGAEHTSSGIRLTPELVADIQSAIPGAEISLGLRQPAILKTDSDFEGVVMMGVDKNGNDFIDNQLIQGSAPDWASPGEGNPVAVSASTAGALSLECGDRLFAHFFIGDNLYTRKITVAAIYDTHFGEYDKLFVFAPVGMLQQLCGVDSLTGSVVEIDKISGDIDEAAANLRYELCRREAADPVDAPAYRVESISTTAALYFNWLDLLDTNIIVIITLMGCVAGFTLVSCLFIIVLERVRMIGLLKALGATDSLIRRLFIYMAARLVVRGLVIGNAAALAIVGIQYFWHILPLDPDAYYLSYVPVHVSWAAIAGLDISVIAAALLLLVLPSHIISTLSPAETMRYE
ncbi:ABC transporter permease [Muribaculaceae bacterium Isolate-104 (HZI)]|nr:ABC transporter permease [Muribaculaceae bacterium Isolate-104 (HZI)]